MGQIKDALLIGVGAVSELAMPQLGREIDGARNTSRAVAIKRAILKARMWRARRSGSEETLEQALTAFWRSASGARFHADWGRASFDHFRNNHAKVIDDLDRFVRASALGFSRLVEIGCGDGAALAYCLEKLPWAERAVGVDVNDAAIDLARLSQSEASRMQFVCADAGAWLAAHPEAGTVVVSNGGVLEYLSQESFDRLLAAMALARPAALLLIEPLDAGHDLDAQPESHPFRSLGSVGSETTFSHNHRARLQAAGFEVVFARETQFGQTRGIVMLGVLQ
jgi:SAM-dependent methyltransferase